MEKSVLNIIDSVIHQKKGLTTSDLIDTEGTFEVKLRGNNSHTHF